jgi:hypothetical protein
LRGRTKARLALLTLTVVVVGASVILATNRRARVRYWTWRMGSSDVAIANKARLELFKIGRPAIDEIMPELIVRELRDRIGDTSWSVQVATKGSHGSFDLPPPLESIFWPGVDVGSDDPVAQLLLPRVRSRALVMLWVGVVFSMEPPSPIAIPLDDDLAPGILRALHEAGL